MEVEGWHRRRAWRFRAMSVLILLALMLAAGGLAAGAARTPRDRHMPPDKMFSIMADEVDDVRWSPGEEDVSPALQPSSDLNHDDHELLISLAELWSEERVPTRRPRPARRRPPAHPPPARPSPKGGTLTFRKSMPARMRFARMEAEAQGRIQSGHSAEAASRSKARSTAKQRITAAAHLRVAKRAMALQRTHAIASAASRAQARAKGDAPDGGDGEWTEKPVWWNDPGEQNVKPWLEDNYAYVLRAHDDPNSNMSPDPYPTLSGGRTSLSRMGHRFALHRVLGTPVVTGTPESVYAYQHPGSPPLPELDATMQPANNYPNPPFYEYDYNKDYVWG